MNFSAPYIWRLIDVEDQVASELSKKLNLPLALARILSLRAQGDVDHFLDPRLSKLSDPFILPGMRGAAIRVCNAIAKGEIILIHGDYDVDGIAAVGLLLRTLGELGATAMPWLPNRMRDGYGFTTSSLSRCLRERPQPGLIVTVDCGTNSADAVAMAAQKGIDVVVTDHHEPIGAPAPAVAVVNPKLGADSNLRALAGVGVAFKFCHAIVKLAREQGLEQAQKMDLRRHLDLVALGTVADIVPLLGENRILVAHGLARLNEAPSPGIGALMEIASIRAPLDAFHIGFMIGPRLNAVGRLGEADRALELLMTEHLPRAGDLALILDSANRSRQELEARIGDEARSAIEADFDPERTYGIAVGSHEWHKGVIGNVASRLASRFRRPTVVVAFEPGGMGKGSCRSIEGFSLLKALEFCGDAIQAFGGHDSAAGLEVRHDRFQIFQERFNQAASKELAGMDLRPVLEISGWLDLSDAKPSFMEALDHLRPFGAENPEPVWAVRGVEAERPYKVGRNHLKFTLRSGNNSCQAIAFNRADQPLPEGPLDVAFRMRHDTYSGNGALQLHVLDVRSSQI